MNRTGRKNRKENRRYREYGEMMELTKEGWIVCGIAGLFETVLTLTACRIDLMYVPVLVFMVLWSAFGIITSVCMLGTGHMNMSIQSAVRYSSCQMIEMEEAWDVKKAS